MSNVHTLRIESHWFDRVANGTKTAEVRKHDRDFQIGDRVRLMTHDEDWHGGNMRNPRVVEATITHILPASVFSVGLQPGYSVLSLGDIGDVQPLDPEADR